MKEGLFLGIGIGASRVKIVAGPWALRDPVVRLRDHMGNPRGVVAEMLAEFDPVAVAGMAVTGGEGASLIDGRKIYEAEAIEEAMRLLDLKADAILSLGGESFVAYPLDPSGRVLDYVAGNRCAAGTVEFFKQQLGRMNLTVEEGTRLAASGRVVPLARRCSVHCKSDCTHALNKNRCTIADIAHTLCHNMAEKAAGLLQNYGLATGHLLVIGGASANPVVVDYLRRLLPQCEVIVPDSAAYFEALGAAALARVRSLEVPRAWSDLFRPARGSFASLKPLTEFADRVTFLPSRRGRVTAGRRYLLGIDGGSTTTKAALVDSETLEICASRYLKTNGNPEHAMKECLVSLRDQVREATGGGDVDVAGVATTGSSGEILSVLCGTPAYHNEIIAHAYGASFFCPDVDTIFEIGGQDSKFTLLRSRVAVDFNMNESCSAGTGSFIEEAAKDDLGVPMESIADLALKSTMPPRFSDQCAAFANTDIRKASQEGLSREDNLAGLCYAIVENYLTKVVGDRKVGDHILFQGGTSKNRAIAFAFAARTGKPITVPPDPELIGCFGIALWLREKLKSGEIPEKAYRIDDILKNAVSERVEFTCRACENLCSIQNLTINGVKHPFGGQCSRWENVRNRSPVEAEAFDLVALRNRLMFLEYGVPAAAEDDRSRPRSGIQAVFSAYGLYPLYSWFFHELGYGIALSERVDPDGVKRCQTNRCYPYEIAHGTFHDLLRREVTHLFVPHLQSMPRDEGAMGSLACPIAQGTPYYLAAAFADTGIRLHRPVLDLSAGIESALDAFVALGAELGHGREDSTRAFRKGCERQRAFEQRLKDEGRRALERIEKEGRLGIVLVGRPYNAFAKVANMGVPRKFASRGVTILPYEFLPFEEEPTQYTMYWKYGQSILKALRFVRRHPRLFPVYISNFGCGPDSFIQHFAGFIMGRKPMLYLELDSHTADAGIGTRAAAFLDIVGGYLQLGEAEGAATPFRAAEFVLRNGQGCVVRGNGEVVPMRDPRVTLVFPSMGRFITEAAAAAAASVGMRTRALPPVDDRVLAIGRSFTSGKECSPAVFTVGSLMSYCAEEHKRRSPDEILLFFMPTASGPCRFGQYHVYMKELVRHLELEDVAIMSPSAADGYGSLGSRFLMAAWQSVVIADLMRDVRAVLLAAAADRGAALESFETEWRRLVEAIRTGRAAAWRALRHAARRLAGIALKNDPRRLPRVLLTGEIYVRSDELSRRNIEELYADEGFLVKIADGMEWVYYTDWHYLNRLLGRQGYPRHFLDAGTFIRQAVRALAGRRPGRHFVKTRIKLAYERSVERKARRVLARTGLLVAEPHAIEHVIDAGGSFIHPALTGEAILTAGSTRVAFEESPGEHYSGVVFIGPFNCMPTGVAESVTKPYARKRGIPMLVFETDGGPMTPNFRSQMEVHMLRSRIYAAEHNGHPLTAATHAPAP